MPCYNKKINIHSEVIMAKTYIHVLSNTHWDREWYMSHEQYLVRLVSLMDRLLDIMEKKSDYIFICDGQFSMVDDYLKARPENTDRVKVLVSEGRLEVGPWFTQPLETLVSGEAMVRNLHYGIEGSKKLGDAMRFSYEVDEFGHASQTPQVLRGFGIEGAIAWRGVPAGSKSAFEWMSPDGTSVIMLRTNCGYGEATALPQSEENYTEIIDESKIERKGLAERVPDMLNMRKQCAEIDTLMWLNGIDHSFAQPDVLEVIEKINSLFPELEVRQTTCEAYFEAVKREYEAKSLPMAKVEGELMYTAEQILESTHACHPRQKQRHYKTERYLERQLEPTAALAWLAGFDPRTWAQDRAWKYVLENHAHDTLGCTSVNEVYEEAMARYSCALSLASQVSEDCRRDVMSRFEGSRPSLTVFNTSSFEVKGVHTFEFDIPEGYGRENFALEDECGNRIPLALLSKVPTLDLRFNPKQGHPTRTPAIHIRAMAEIPAVAPFGWRRFNFIPNGTRTYFPNRRSFHFSPEAGVMENEHLRCVINPNGTVVLTDKATGRSYPNQFTFEDNGDVENVYIHLTPFENKTYYSTGCAAEIAMLYDNSLGCCYEVKLNMRIPEGAIGKDSRDPHSVDLPITLLLTLGKGDRHLGAALTIDNRAKEHRLRVLFPTHLTEAAKSRGGQPFDVVERCIHEEENIDGLFEQPYPTHPMQDICDVTGNNCGLTVAAEGIYEYECIDNASRALALTLLRCNNTIDKSMHFDLTEAENIGSITYKFALFPHGGDWREVYGNAITYLTNPVFTLDRAPEESVMVDYKQPEKNLPDTGAAVKLEGEHLMITAVKKAYGRNSLIVRILNYGNAAADGKLSLAFPGIVMKEAYETTLDEERMDKLEICGNETAFTLRKAGIMTVELVM